MPQAFFELLYKGETGPNLLAFWWQYVDFDMEFSIITPTYNHLWYVVYVLIYTLLVAALLPVLRWLAPVVERGFGWMERSAGGWLLVVVPAAYINACSFILADDFPVTHALVDDWYNHLVSFSMLLFGWFAAKSKAFWRGGDKSLRLAIAVAMATGLALVVMRATQSFASVFDLVEGVFAWSVILSLLGLGQRYLNRPGKLLSYLNEAVFPYYILHQTLIVVIGAALIPSGLPLWAEVSLIVVGAIAGCGLGYELIRRVTVLRPLFGLSWSGGNRSGPVQARGDGVAVERALADDDKRGFAGLAGLPRPVEVAGDAGTHGLYGEAGTGTR